VLCNGEGKDIICLLADEPSEPFYHEFPTRFGGKGSAAKDDNNDEEDDDHNHHHDVAIDDNVTFEERYCNAADDTEDEMEDWKQSAKQLQRRQALSLTDPKPTTMTNKIYSGIPKDNKTGIDMTGWTQEIVLCQVCPSHMMVGKLVISHTMNPRHFFIFITQLNKTTNSLDGKMIGKKDIY
jgi:hypothetical protein